MHLVWPPIPVTRVSDVVKGGALSDTLRKLTSAHLAGGPTPHEGWALAGGGQRGEGGGEQTHRPRGKNPSRAVGGGGSNETETKSIIKCIKIICVDHYHVHSELDHKSSSVKINN